MTAPTKPTVKVPIKPVVVAPKGKATSPVVAAKAAKVLTSPDATADEKSVAASALAQVTPGLPDAAVGSSPGQLVGDLAAAKRENERLNELVVDLTAQLNDANLRAERAERAAGEQAAWAARQRG